MKPLLTSILIIFGSFNLFSQEKQIINTGINFSHFMGGQLGYSQFRFNTKPGFYIEKPIEIDFFNIELLSINPGFEYFSIKENCYHARSSNEYNRDVYHESITFYLKIIKKYEIKDGPWNWYFGPFSGIHLYSSSKAEESWKVYYLNGNSYGGKETIDQKGRSDFFHLVYYGALIGFEREFKKITWLKPGLELKWFPNFGTVRKDNYKENFGGLGITLNLGFYK